VLLAAIGVQSALRQATGPSGLPWKCYVGSIYLLYALLLVAINARLMPLVAALVAANAGVHAVEYLAIVTHYARRREHTGSRGLFAAMAKEWTWLLVAYMVLLGSLAVISNERYRDAWLAINLSVAFMHYAYDGLIWKLREAKTSAALGVEVKA
jgi:hypothetical protein